MCVSVHPTSKVSAHMTSLSRMQKSPKAVSSPRRTVFFWPVWSSYTHAHTGTCKLLYVTKYYCSKVCHTCKKKKLRLSFDLRYQRMFAMFTWSKHNQLYWNNLNIIYYQCMFQMSFSSAVSTTNEMFGTLLYLNSARSLCGEYSGTLHNEFNSFHDVVVERICLYAKQFTPLKWTGI